MALYPVPDIFAIALLVYEIFRDRAEQSKVRLHNVQHLSCELQKFVRRREFRVGFDEGAEFGADFDGDAGDDIVEDLALAVVVAVDDRATQTAVTCQLLEGDIRIAEFTEERTGARQDEFIALDVVDARLHSMEKVEMESGDEKYFGIK